MSRVSEFKKKKELEKARQTGQLAPETDTASGKLINPHNPEFITNRPWYLGESGPSLTHHSKQKNDELLSVTETDQLLEAKQLAARNLRKAVKFRPGACRNCGAMGHKTVECVERPRSAKNAAWKSNRAYAKDDIVLKLEDHGKVGYDTKRDRWQGYRPEQHRETVERYSKMDEERSRLRKEQMEEEEKHRREEEAQQKQIRTEERRAAREARGEDPDAPSEDSASDTDTDAESGDSDDEFHQRAGDEKDFQGRVARQGGLGGAQMATTVRNLRIREDRAKYLYNLDPESAYYDPKTRSMRDNPNPQLDPTRAAYAGDNFARGGEDVRRFAQTQLFAWDAAERGQDLHPIADPSQAELVHKTFNTRKENLKNDKKKRILSHYGGTEYLEKPDPRLVLGQTEVYVEYDRTGRVVKGGVKGTVRSKYVEDVFPGNHTSVWGSYMDLKSMRWGFSCCHSLIRGSYCTGSAGQEANDAANTPLAVDASQLRNVMAPPPPPISTDEVKTIPRKDQHDSTKPHRGSEVYGESLNPTLDTDKLKEAVRKEKAFIEEKKDVGSDIKRKYNSMTSCDVTQEEMEAYRILKGREQDPMSNISSDTLL